MREALADSYAVERELGRGGMATVFRAKDLKHRRQVAIKVLDREVSAQVGPERFAREIEIAARLQHPHILPLYDSGSARGLLYYVMPLVEGESLRERLDREKQLSQDEAIRITSEVASALSYAHSHGVVHRDIKPENILLSGGTAVVADFGIARAVDERQPSLTKTGTVIGTPVYMSPEQATGETQIDGRSDQYSLACVLYELLVGQPPFTGPTAQAILARHSLDMVSPPSIMRPGIPDAMEDALLKALSKVPSDRYATTLLFAEAVATPSRVSEYRARHPDARIGAGGGTGRRARLKTVAAVAGGIVLLGGAWALVGAIRGSGTASASDVDPRRIAVLYFDHRGDSARTHYLADGLTEALIHELAAVKVLQVISANGVRPFRSASGSVRPDSVRRALGVGTIVQGTVTEYGNRLRVEVALVDAATGTETKSTRLERPRTELFALQDTLSRAVSEFLRLAIGEEVQLREMRAGTRSVAAWELVQQASEARKTFDSLMENGDVNGGGAMLARADSLLARAHALDSRWTLPIVERGWLAREQSRLFGWDKGPAREWTDRGLRFADQALGVRPDSEAIHLRGTMRYLRYIVNIDVGSLSGERLLDAAEADLRAGGAARSNPRRASALALLSHLLMRRSQPAQGKLAALQAWEADEYLTEANSVIWRLFAASLDLEDAAEAARWCGEGHRRFPDDPFFTECRISLYALRGLKPDVPELWSLVDQYAKMWPENFQEYRRKRVEIFLSMALANAGLLDSAKSVALHARGDPTIDPTNDLVYLEVAARNVMGDREEAVRLLGRYLATNPQDRESIARDETWFFRGLRDDPRFKVLVGTGR